MHDQYLLTRPGLPDIRISFFSSESARVEKVCLRNGYWLEISLGKLDAGKRKKSMAENGGDSEIKDCD